MKTPERLSVALHVLLHMAERPEQPMTSEEMAACVGTNPVVIRRSFAGLREAGVVSSVKGHGGGWRLARAPDQVSLAQIQQALGERMVPLAAKHDAPQCLIVRAVVDVLDEAMREAEQVLDRRLATLTLADLAAHAQRLHGRRHMKIGGGGHAS
ncbi:Rrf2 family transcriptional regulator [Lysobacter capsici]|uniref:Rrf2 family transcriptional regulator n=1 Tax=Lysobacter capsici TaxID=435897 RepID=UPI001C00412E|nr:Rrf2 family transcriptional regulator [Lysobacter capsici]MBW8811147.1 Rrf2 family transcriptional regulator [Lysobacter sp.]QWF15073.1 Rrf2 family transcriptional regulator [Lysobacter capsici]